jgi:hypothetical protein
MPVGFETLQMLSSLIPKMTKMTAAPTGVGGSGGFGTQLQFGTGGGMGGGSSNMPQGRKMTAPTPIASPSGGGMPTPPQGNPQGGMANTGKYGQGGGTFNQQGQPVIGGTFNNAGQPIATGGQSTGGGDATMLNKEIRAAQDQIRKYENPKGIYDKGVAKAMLPRANERLDLALQNKVDYEQAQAAIANEQDARLIAQAYGQQFGMGEADRVYTLINNDPSGETAKQFTSDLSKDMGAAATAGRTTTENIRKEDAAIDNALTTENRKSEELATFYMEETPMGQTDKGRLFASGLARNNVAPEVGFKMWNDHQDAIAEGNAASQKDIEKRVTRNGTYQYIQGKITDMRRISKDAWINPVGMGAAATRGVLGLFGDDDSGANIGKGTSFGEMKTIAKEITSNTVVDELGRLKEMSATGGTGFGQFTEKELALVERIKGDIDPDRPPEEFWGVVDDYEKIIKRLQWMNNNAQDFINSVNARGDGADPVKEMGEYLDKNYPIKGEYTGAPAAAAPAAAPEPAAAKTGVMTADEYLESMR